MSSRRKSKLKGEVEADAILDSTLYDFTWWSAQACGNRLPDLIQSFVSYQAQYSEELEHVQLLLAFLRSIDGKLPQIDPQLYLATLLLASVKETDDKTSDLNQLLGGARTALRTKSTRSKLLPLNSFLTVHPAHLLHYKSKLNTDGDAQVLLMGGALIVRNADKIELATVADGQIYGTISAETSVMFPIGKNLGVFNTAQSKLQLFDVSKAQLIKEVPLSKQKVTKPKKSATEESDDAEPDADGTQFVSYEQVKDSTEDSIILFSGLTTPGFNTIYVLTGLNSSESDSAKVQLFSIIEKCQSREVIGFLSSRKAFYVTVENEVFTFDLDGDDGGFKQTIMCPAECVGRVTDSKVGIVTHFNGAYRVFMEKKIEDIGVNSPSEVISTELVSEHGRYINMAWIGRLELGLVMLFVSYKIYWIRLSSDGKVKGRGSLALPECYFSRSQCYEFTYRKKNYLFINCSPELCVCLSGSQIEIVGRMPSFTGYVFFNNKYFGWYNANANVKGEVYDLKIMLEAKPIKFDAETPQKKLEEAFHRRCNYVKWTSTWERQIQYFIDQEQMDMGVIENGGKSIKIINDLPFEPINDESTFAARHCNGNLLYVTNMDETSKKVDFMEYDWQQKKSKKIASYGEAMNYLVYSPITDSWYATWYAGSDKSKFVQIDVAKKKVDTFQLDKKVPFPVELSAATSDLLLLTHWSSLYVLKASGQNLMLRTTHEHVENVRAGTDYYSYQTSEEGGNKLMVVDCDSCKPIKQILVPSMDGQPQKVIMPVQDHTFVGSAQLLLMCTGPDNYDQTTILVYDFLAGDDDLVMASVQICLGKHNLTDWKGSALSNVFSARVADEGFAVFAFFELVTPDQPQTAKKKLSIKSSIDEQESHSKTCKIM